MKVYQPTVLNTLAPYAGPQGFGMDKMTGQTIDQQTTAGSNQIDPLPFRGYSVPAPSLRYYGLSEMRPKGPTGRPTIPGGQMIMTTPGSTRPTPLPVMISPAMTTPANVETVIFTPDQTKPWYKSPLYFALLAAGAFWLAKKSKIV
jgi:hypothetical protein